MFEIIWTNSDDMFKQTQACFKEIEGIEQLVAFQNRLFKSVSDEVCFSDAQIDGLEYPPDHNRLTVYICYNIERTVDQKQIKEAHMTMKKLNRYGGMETWYFFLVIFIAEGHA